MSSTTLSTVLRVSFRHAQARGRKRKVINATLMVACLVSLLCAGGCGGGSGSSAGTPPSPPSNPVPAILSLSPNFVNAGGAAFTLTVTGQNFLSSSTVQWNGSPRATTFSSSTQLEAQVTVADIATSGLATVSVNNPAPGGGSSGSAEFTINASSNPAPSLASLSPSFVNAGSPGFILTLTGTNFIPVSTIQWNGANVPTNYLSQTQLETQIPAASIATSGFAGITVVNPGPGGGTSTAMIFSIAYTPLVVNQKASDLVWDPTHQLIYVSVPSLASSNGNTITAIDPLTGNIKASQFAGSEPDRLAISGDDQFLYAGIDGSASVERFTLPGLLPDIKYSLGADSTSGPRWAADIGVAPGLPHTTAVSRGISNTSVYALGGMEVFDDATPRAGVSDAHNLFDSLQWGSDTQLYANNSESTGFDFFVLGVNSGGVVLNKDYQNEFSKFYMSIHYDSGTKLVYGDDGNVVDPTTGLHVGAFQASGLIVPDSALNSAFFLGQIAAQVGTQNFTIESFNLTTFAPIAEIVVPGVQGNPLHLIRWGTNGLAFNDDAGYVYILNTSFVTAHGARVLTPQRKLIPVAKTRSAPKVIRMSKAVPNVNAKANLAKKAYLSHSVIPNPAPSITALSPSAVTVGVNGLTLTVIGSNFVSLSTIEWNGSQRSTEFVSSSELQAQIGASDVASPGSVSVSVVTPGPGGGTSSALPFTVVAAANPVPSIVSLYPSAVAAGSGAFTLDVNGLAYFNASSVVEWNGSPRSSSLYSPGQLQVQINASDVASVGYALVSVTNPGPGGGTSAAPFQVLYQPTIVNQVTNDMVCDPLHQVIYISVPASASTRANQVCVLNPITATIVSCQSAGSEPDVLAISDDSHFLYVGEDGTGSVQRFILPSLTPDISYSLGNYGSGTPYYALDLQVAPGAPHTVAVTRGAPVIPAAQGGITIFDDSTPRPISAPGWNSGYSFDSLQWGADATVLYAADTESASNGFNFYTLSVSSSGIVLKQDYPSVFWNPGRIHYDRATGLVYSDDGFHAVDPSTGLPAGIFEVGGGWPMAPDSTLNAVFILSKYVWQGNANYTIDVFDMTHYVPVAQIPFSTVQNGLGRLGRFIRWGTNGLALNDRQGNVYLISGSFVSGAPR
jgi:hypothetical protein